MEFPVIDTRINLNFKVPVKKKYTSVWLEVFKESNEHLFFCLNCQCPLFKYYGDVISLMPGNASEVMDTPLEIQCHGKSQTFGKCPYTYIIEGYLN